jgi:hypothetical protein
VNKASIKMALIAVAEKFQRRCRKLYNRVVFEPVTRKATDTINGIECEADIIDRCGKVVGRWAYGAYDLSGPYKE